MSDSASRGAAAALVLRPLGGDVAGLRLGVAGTANVNCGWVGSGDAAGAADPCRPRRSPLWISTTEQADRADERAQTAAGAARTRRSDVCTRRFGSGSRPPSCPTVDTRQ